MGKAVLASIKMFVKHLPRGDDHVVEMFCVNLPDFMPLYGPHVKIDEVKLSPGL